MEDTLWRTQPRGEVSQPNGSNWTNWEWERESAAEHCVWPPAKPAIQLGSKKTKEYKTSLLGLLDTRTLAPAEMALWSSQGDELWIWRWQNEAHSKAIYGTSSSDTSADSSIWNTWEMPNVLTVLCKILKGATMMIKPRHSWPQWTWDFTMASRCVYK